ncbi:hypothetical protein V8E53_014495 [Lactarius tabidus]
MLPSTPTDRDKEQQSTATKQSNNRPSTHSPLSRSLPRTKRDTQRAHRPTRPPHPAMHRHLLFHDAQLELLPRGQVLLAHRHLQHRDSEGHTYTREFEEPLGEIEEE